MRPFPFTLVLTLFVSTAAMAQVNNTDRFRGHTMLRSIRDEIRKSYYDPNFRGIVSVDLDPQKAGALFPVEWRK